jgi:hypothetical protein
MEFNVTTNVTANNVLISALLNALVNTTHVDSSRITIQLPSSSSSSGLVRVTITPLFGSQTTSTQAATIIRNQLLDSNSILNVQTSIHDIHIVPGSWSLISIIETALLAALQPWQLALFTVLLVFVLVCLYYGAHYKWPKGHHLPIVYIFLSLLTFCTHCFFVNFLSSQQQRDTFKPHFVAAVICMCLSYTASIISVLLIYRAANIKDWCQQHLFVTILNVVLGGFNPGSARLISSNAFHLTSLLAPVAHRFNLMLYTAGLLTLMVEIPMIIIQLMVVLYFKAENQGLERNSMLSLVATILMLGFGVSRRLIAARRVKQIQEDRAFGIEITY